MRVLFLVVLRCMVFLCGCSVLALVCDCFVSFRFVSFQPVMFVVGICSVLVLFWCRLFLFCTRVLGLL